jgi:hypothetical protein
MKPFAAKLRNGQQFLGIALSTEDILQVKAGNHVSLDLSSIGVGLWIMDPDGKRHFLQPRDSHVLVIAGDSKEDVAEFLNVPLS